MTNAELPNGALSFSKTLEDGSTILLKAPKRKPKAAKKIKDDEPKTEPTPEITEDN